MIRGGWGGRNKSFALGRMKAGKMNDTEAAFALWLDAEQHAGRVLWWKFQGMTFLLAYGEQVCRTYMRPSHLGILRDVLNGYLRSVVAGSALDA